MLTWTPVAVLPNLFASQPVEGGCVAFVPAHDTRIAKIVERMPKFADFLSRFTDPFGAPVEPVIFIVEDTYLPMLRESEAFTSFRDIVAMSVLPYARALTLVSRNSNKILYSNSFALYPWMIAADGDTLIAVTPALVGLHQVEYFQGQSSPELSRMELTDCDEPLFDALIARWKKYFLGNAKTWKDRALFRSLNMAFHAAQLPSGMGATVPDFGRTVALWVSAFEILSHPRRGKASLRSVYPLLSDISYQDRDVGRRAYAAFDNRQRKNQAPQRLPLPCWLYGELYRVRCDFLHGNPLGKNPLNPRGIKILLTAIASSLYRLALTGFLAMPAIPRPPRGTAPLLVTRYNDQLTASHQAIIERSLLRAKK